jgi:hypothetical protein
MKKRLVLLIIFCFLAGCSSKPVPDWTLNSFNRLEAFKKNYLEGNLPIAEMHFKKAVEEIKMSGDLDILARAYLTRMAMQAAVLEKVQDDDFRKIEAAESHTENANYHLFLTGNLNRVQESLLPTPYHDVLKLLLQGRPDKLAGALAEIKDPVSRLIASGVCTRLDQSDEGVLKLAAETASQNGWKKALLAYLGVMESAYAKQGQAEKAAAVRQKRELITP